MAASNPAKHQDSDVQAEVRRLASGYTRAQQVLELTGVSVFGALAAYTLVQLVRACVATSASGISVAIAAALALFGGLLFADFASGFVHWAADNWGSDHWPVVGAAFIRPFRLHHLDAKDISKHTFLELNGNNSLVSLPLFWVANHALNASATGIFWGAFWLSVALWVMATNQFHAWAHADDPPRIARVLQRARLILSVPHHDQHHRAPYARNYCITTGWFNGPLRAVKFFEGLEWLMTRVTGVQANHHVVESNLLRYGDAHGMAQNVTKPAVASQALKTE